MKKYVEHSANAVILFFAFFVLTATTSSCSAQYPDWTVYNTSNSGLSGNDVRALAIEGSNKWIGTEDGGLAKLSGTNWTVYDTSNSGLPVNDIWALAIEGSNKWIGTYYGGLAVYNTAGGEVEENSNVKNQSAKLELTPNPFLHSTTIKYYIPARAKISLNIYDISGRTVKLLVNEQKNAGNHEVDFNATGLPFGIYFAKFESGDYRETQKLILVR